MQNVNNIILKNNQILTYLQLNFSVIPLKSNSKEPATNWKKYARERITEKDIARLWKNGENIGIVCGAVSCLVVVDADTQETIEFLESIKEFKETAKVKTKRGKHYYFYISDIPEDFGSQKIYKDPIRIDIKANGGYVVAPPSIVDGHTYEWIGDDIKEITFEELLRILNEIKEKLEIDKKQKEIKTEVEEEGEAKIDLEKLKEVVKKHYTEGRRQDICLYLAGWLRKKGINKEEVEKFITELCFDCSDKDIKQRLSAVTETFEKTIEELKGFSGLIEIIPERELKQCIKNGDDEYIYLFDNFFEKDNILYEIIEKNKGAIKSMVGPYLHIKTKYINDNNEVEYEVEFKNKTFAIKEIQDIEQIRKKTGIAIIREKKFLEYMNFLALNCKTENKIYATTGWRDGIYLHPIRQTNCLWRHIITDKKANNLKHADKQIGFIKEALQEGKFLGLSYVFSLSALMNELVESNPFCLLITGISGTGKTTVGKAVCNVFYDSDKMEITMNTTQNALEIIMQSLKDMTLLVDEVALKSSTTDMEKIIFMAYSKTGKARANKQLVVKLNELNSNIIITSEMCELEQLKRTGALRRLIHLSIASRNDFTDNFRELINSLQYCGGVVYFAEFLEKIRNTNDFTEILNYAENNARSCKDLYSITKSMLATIKTLEYFYNSEFKQTRETIVNTLLKHEMEVNERKNITEVFLHRFREYITINHNKFIEDKKNETWGKKDDNFIYILTSKFNEFCKENDFHTDLLMKELEKQNILIRTSHKERTITTRINGVVVRCLKIKIEDEPYNPVTT